MFLPQMEPESADVKQHVESRTRDAEPLRAAFISPPRMSLSIKKPSVD